MSIKIDQDKKDRQTIWIKADVLKEQPLEIIVLNKEQHRICALCNMYGKKQFLIFKDSHDVSLLVLG